jgi:PleD family two-component response regulator
VISKYKTAVLIVDSPIQIIERLKEILSEAEDITVIRTAVFL